MKMDTLKSVLMISHSNKSGGAARASERLHSCLLSNNQEVEFVVASKSSANSGVKKLNLYRSLLCSLYSRVDFKICKFLDPYNSEWQSGAFIGSLSARFINKSKFDVVNLHWLGHGLISLRQMRKITKPIVWTLHDEWSIHAISHYPETNFNKSNRNPIARKLSAVVKQNRIKQKKLFLSQDNVFLVSLSSEMAAKLVAKFPAKSDKIFIVANPVDLTKFHPAIEKNNEYKLNLLNKKPLVLFLGGTQDKRKGWDLLEKALDYTKAPFTLIVIGDLSRKQLSKNNDIDIIAIEKISNINSLRRLYVSSHVVIVPSRIEGLPQTATEALSCGTPVVGFKIGGLLDIVINNQTGFLAEPFDTRELGLAIDKIVNLEKSNFISNCRTLADDNFSFKAVSSKYNRVFSQATNI